MSYIFISHSSENKEYANHLSSFLKANDFDIWVDKDNIAYGSDWEESIYEGVVNCNALIVIMTPSARKSKWVKLEIEWADKLKKPIFPIHLTGKIFPRFVLTQCYPAHDFKLPKDDFLSALRDVIPETQAILGNNGVIRTDGLFMRRLIDNQLQLGYMNIVWFETLKFNDDFTFYALQSTEPTIVEESYIAEKGSIENYEISSGNLIFRISGERFLSRYHANKLITCYITVGRYNSIIPHLITYNFIPFN